ncbi:MAG: tryptophan--tRNA ligase, partial [bacterium]|nr:tryptophan--tRNA ligase [bacterium]
EKKMSKSAPTPKNYISLMDDEATVLKKVKSAVTDSGTTIEYDPERKGLANLLTIYTLVSKRTIEDIVREHDGKGYGDFKKNLAAAISNFLTPLQERIQAHLENEEELKRILDMGAKKAKVLAEQKMDQVRSKIGVNL